MLIDNPIFDEVRVKCNEEIPTKQIDMKMDYIPIDPETGEKREFSIKNLQKYLIKQVVNFHHDAKKHARKQSMTATNKTY